MAYTTPPTFTDGNVLSAAQLNTLSDDIDYLAGFGQRINIPFTEFATASDETVYYRLKYNQRYLHYRYSCNNNLVDDIRIYYDGHDVWHDGSPNMGTTTGYIDLQTDFPAITPGGTYEVQADIKGGNGTLTLQYILLASTTTL